MIFGSELFHDGTFGKSHIVLIGRNDTVGIFFRGTLNHLEERGLLLLAVDDERAAEDFVATVLGVDLGKAEHFAVGERTAELALHLMEILYLLG